MMAEPRWCHTVQCIGFSQGRQVTVICGHNTILVGINLGRHCSVLYGHHVTLVGLRLGWHGSLLCRHQAKLAGMMVLSQVASTPNFLEWTSMGMTMYYVCWSEPRPAWHSCIWPPSHICIWPTCYNHWNKLRMVWSCLKWPQCYTCWNDTVLWNYQSRCVGVRLGQHGAVI